HCRRSGSGHNRSWHLRFSHRPRLRDLARGFDEELRGRIERAIFDRENSNRPADDRQFDRQFPDEWMRGGKREQGFGLDRQIAAKTRPVPRRLTVVSRPKAITAARGQGSPVARKMSRASSPKRVPTGGKIHISSIRSASSTRRRRANRLFTPAATK